MSPENPFDRKIRFGPAGNADSFAAEGNKSTVEAPAWLAAMGLAAYEYQCGHGVRVSDKTAAALREQAERHGIRLSLHAPYYISLSGAEEEKRLASVGYILQAARAADKMGADRIVVHSGSCSGISREEALALASDTLRRAIGALDAEGLGHVHVCPEVMGKVNQLGTLEEVLALCGLDERLIPCVDFGHLNARTFGGLRGYEDYAAVLDAMEAALGAERAGSFHAHFSRIEYTETGGEKRHWTLADEQYGPDFAPLARLLAERGATPTIICESRGTQAEDACAMRELYERARQDIEQG